jgi:membrane protease YdiL (CAAX protease family)
MQIVTPATTVALAIALVPVIAFGAAGERVARAVQRWSVAVRMVAPAVCALPYVLTSLSQHIFRWQWLALYAGLPVVTVWLLGRAAAVDTEQRGNWRDAAVLLVLGLAVDLRWFDGAWPSGLHALSKLILLDAGLYGFQAVRQLSGTGFTFCLRWSDWKIGLRELAFFTPLVLMLGLALGFLHPHANLPSPGAATLRWIAIAFATALPEELFFRAWVQNLLERRAGRVTALVITSALFGLSHFNKRAAHFNWRYVLLAGIAGIFYGRAWREQRRIPASIITHASVDWMWSWWF